MRIVRHLAPHFLVPQEAQWRDFAMPDTLAPRRHRSLGIGRSGTMPTQNRRTIQSWWLGVRIPVGSQRPNARPGTCAQSAANHRRITCPTVSENGNARPWRDQNEPNDWTRRIVTPALRGPRKGFDWISSSVSGRRSTLAGGAAGMALTWSEAVGPSRSAVLVVALGAMVLVLVLWAVRGARAQAGRVPRTRRGRGGGAVDAQASRVAGGAGGARADLRSRRRELSRRTRPISSWRRWRRTWGRAAMRRRSTACSASIPGMAAPIYRLSRAVKIRPLSAQRNPSACASCSATAHQPIQFEASVAPLGKPRARCGACAVIEGANAQVEPRSIRARSMSRMRRSASSRRGATGASSMSTWRLAPDAGPARRAGNGSAP